MTDLENPVFTGVTIDNTASTEVGFTGGKFVGSYSPVPFTANDQTKLFLGGESKLFWPETNITVYAFRAYFDLGGNQARQFVLNFGDSQDTGIRSLTPNPSPFGEGSAQWFTLDGRKLSGKPTAKGLYIYNGKAVVIK